MRRHSCHANRILIFTLSCLTRSSKFFTVIMFILFNLFAFYASHKNDGNSFLILNKRDWVCYVDIRLSCSDCSQWHFFFINSNAQILIELCFTIRTRAQFITHCEMNKQIKMTNAGKYLSDSHWVRNLYEIQCIFFLRFIRVFIISDMNVSYMTGRGRAMQQQQPNYKYQPFSPKSCAEFGRRTRSLAVSYDNNNKQWRPSETALQEKRRRQATRVKTNFILIVLILSHGKW